MYALDKSTFCYVVHNKQDMFFSKRMNDINVVDFSVRSHMNLPNDRGNCFVRVASVSCILIATVFVILLRKPLSRLCPSHVQSNISHSKFG